MFRKFKIWIVSSLSKLLALVISQDNVQAALNRRDSKFINEIASSETIASMLDALISRADFKKDIWKLTNVRPDGFDMRWAAIPNSIREQRMIQATIETGKFVHKNIPHLEGKRNPFETLDEALSAVSIKDGLYLEFGVFSGTTINYIAKKINVEGKKIHGFDSFEGLPEDWGAAKKGTFNTNGVLPEVSDNVILHKGWFDETIQSFVSENKQPIAFLHADADLYSSTKTILGLLKMQIVKDTVIVFDEYFNYPYWQEHEYKAFMEFIAETGKQFEYIAYSDRGYSVAVKITG